MHGIVGFVLVVIMFRNSIVDPRSAFTHIRYDYFTVAGTIVALGK